MDKKLQSQIVIIFVFFLILLSTVSHAHEKVVVIPLSSSRSQAAGLDEQIQYNDAGNLAGANLYYRKTTGSFGFGTSNPDSAMRIDVNGFARYRLGAGEIFITTPGSFPGLIAFNSDRSKRSDIIFKNGKIYLNTSPNGTVPAANNGVVIGTAGHVGIGTETPQAKLEVRGEIRTTDAGGNSRLWGTGRPHVGLNQTVAYSNYWVALSTTNVPWEAASQACPLGSWVCTRAERGTADFDSVPITSSLEYMDCNNDVQVCTIWGGGGPPESCWDAWTVDRSMNDGLKGLITRISGTQDQIHMCNRMKVWCCGELGNIL